MTGSTATSGGAPPSAGSAPATPAWVHARGFPELKVDTLCGEDGPVPEPGGKFTCPRCIEIGGQPGQVTKRLEVMAGLLVADAIERNVRVAGTEIARALTDRSTALGAPRLARYGRTVGLVADDAGVIAKQLRRPSTWTPNALRGMAATLRLRLPAVDEMLGELRGTQEDATTRNLVTMVERLRGYADRLERWGEDLANQRAARAGAS
jgi:hypothetical protein